MDLGAWVGLALLLSSLALGLYRLDIILNDNRSPGSLGHDQMADRSWFLASRLPGSVVASTSTWAGKVPSLRRSLLDDAGSTWENRSKSVRYMVRVHLTWDSGGTGTSTASPRTRPCARICSSTDPISPRSFRPGAYIVRYCLGCSSYIRGPNQGSCPYCRPTKVPDGRPND